MPEWLLVALAVAAAYGGFVALVTYFAGANRRSERRDRMTFAAGIAERLLTTRPRRVRGFSRRPEVADADRRDIRCYTPLYDLNAAQVRQAVARGEIEVRYLPRKREMA